MRYPLYTYQASPTDKPTVLLGHGNGLPPEAYRALAKALSTDYDSVCLPARPYWDPTGYSNFKSWHELADDMVAGIQHHHLAPIIAIGHSMSGVMLAINAVNHPELFKAIILVDPVFLPRPFMRLAAILRHLGVPFNRRMVEGALKRRRIWDTPEDAFNHFRKRSLFQNCSNDVLRDYVEGSLTTTADNDHVTLKYPPEWEAAIFSRPPIDEWRYPTQITVPCYIIIGEQSNVFQASAVQLWQRQRPDIKIVHIPETGHLVPFEAPQQVAERILVFLRQQHD